LSFFQPNRYAESWVKYHNNLVQNQSTDMQISKKISFLSCTKKLLTFEIFCPQFNFETQPNNLLWNFFSANNDRNRRDKKRRHQHHSKSSANLTSGSSVSAARSYYPISTNGPEFGTVYGSDEERDVDRVSPESEEILGNDILLCSLKYLFKRNFIYRKYPKPIPFPTKR